MPNFAKHYKEMVAKNRTHDEDASEYAAVLAGEVNKAMNQLDEMAATYEKYKELIELAASKPEYRLAVVEIRADEPSFWKPTKRRVVKMEGNNQYTEVEGD